MRFTPRSLRSSRSSRMSKIKEDWRDSDEDEEINEEYKALFEQKHDKKVKDVPETKQNLAAKRVAENRSPRPSCMRKIKKDRRDNNEDKERYEEYKALFEPKRDKKVRDDPKTKGYQNTSFTTPVNEKESRRRCGSNKGRKGDKKHPEIKERNAKEHEDKERENKEIETNVETKEAETRELEPVHDFVCKEGDEATDTCPDAIGFAESSDDTYASGSTLTSESNRSWYVSEALNGFVQWGNSLLDEANSPYDNAKEDPQEKPEGIDSKMKDKIRENVYDTVGTVVGNIYAELGRAADIYAKLTHDDDSEGDLSDSISPSSFEEDMSHYTAASHISLEISIKDALLHQSPADVEKAITDAMSKVLKDQNYQIGTKAHEIESLHKALQAATKASIPDKPAIDVDRITRDVVESIAKELDERLIIQAEEIKQLHVQIENSVEKTTLEKEKEMGTLQAQMKALHEEKDALQDKNLALLKEKKIVEAEKQVVTELDEKLLLQTVEIERLRSKFNSSAEKMVLEEEMTALKAQLKDIQEERAALQAKNYALQKEKDAMEAEKISLDAVNRVAELIQEKADLQAKNTSLQREKDRFEAERRALDPISENGTKRMIENDSPQSSLSSSPRSSASGKKGSELTQSSQPLLLSREGTYRPRSFSSLRRNVNSLLSLLSVRGARKSPALSTSTRRYKKSNRRFGSWKKGRGTPPRPLDFESTVDNRQGNKESCESKQSQQQIKTMTTKELEASGEDKSKALVPKLTPKREEEPQTPNESTKIVESNGQKMDLFTTQQTNEREQEQQTSNQSQTTKEHDETTNEQLTTADDCKLCLSNSAEARLELESHLPEFRGSGVIQTVAKNNSF